MPKPMQAAVHNPRMTRPSETAQALPVASPRAAGRQTAGHQAGIKPSSATNRKNPANHESGRPSTELALADLANRLLRSPGAYRAAHVHLSKLRPQNRQSHHLRLAKSAFDRLRRRFECRLFELKTDDVVLVVNDAPVEEIDHAIQRLRHLFSDDPLAWGGGENATPAKRGAAPAKRGAGPGESDAFCTWYKLDEDSKSFDVDMRTLRDKAASAMSDDGAHEKPPIDIDTLKEARSALLGANLASLIRRQPICALPPGGEPETFFQEIYVGIAQLANSIAPNVRLTGDRWLFQYLTNLLDRRVLALLNRSDAVALGQKLSLNMNLATVMSEDFDKFDRNLRANARGTVMVELQMVDVFSDIGAFFFVRDMLREKEYVLALDGVTYLSLPFVDRRALGVDYLKLCWNAEIVDDPSGCRHDMVKAMIDRAGEDRVILTRCDSSEAIGFGRALGVNLFQGHVIDRYLASKAGARRGASQNGEVSDRF